jgi:cytochrome c-type biogenesis protein CcmE
MTARQQRLGLLLAGLLVICAGLWFVSKAFEKNMVFFFTPSQVRSGEVPQGRSFRVGGLVEAGSLQRGPDGLSVTFVVTDLAQRVNVRYKGLLPDLFKEGKGVVAQGKLVGDQVFVADEVLAKHDENYMPPEARDALKQAKAGSP